MVIKDFIFWIIPIVVLILLAVIYFGPESGFEQLKEVVAGLKEYTPEVSIGQRQVGVQQILSASRVQEVNVFVTSLQQVANSPRVNCIGKVADFSDLEEEGSVLRVRLSHHPVENGDNTSIFIETSKGTAVYEIAGMKPCVIAGSAEVAKNFFESVIKPGDRNFREPYTNPIRELRLEYSNQGVTGWDGNVIRVPEFGSSAVNDQTDNFESEGYIFKGKNHEVCFFPTNDVADFDKDGIDDDYVANAGVPNSISSQYARGGDAVC